MVVVLLVVLLVVGRLVSAVELCYNSCVPKINILCGLSAVDIVSAVCVERPHFIKVQRLGILRVFIRTLSVLSVDISGVVA